MGKQVVVGLAGKILVSDRRLGGDAFLVRVAEALERAEGRREDGVVAGGGLDEERGAVAYAKEAAGKEILGVCEVRRMLARGRRVRERRSIKVGVVRVVEKVGFVHGIELGRQVGGLLLPRTGVLGTGERRAVVRGGVRVGPLDLDGGGRGRGRWRVVGWTLRVVSCQVEADLLFDRWVIGEWTATSDIIIRIRASGLHSISGAVVVEHRMEF